MKGEEPSKRRVRDAKVTPNPLYKTTTYKRNRRKKISDDSSPPI